MRLLKLKEVMERYGVTKPTIYRWIKGGLFPRGVQFGPHTVRWYESDLDAHDRLHPPIYCWTERFTDIPLGSFGDKHSIYADSTLDQVIGWYWYER